MIYLQSKLIETRMPGTSLLLEMFNIQSLCIVSLKKFINSLVYYNVSITPLVLELMNPITTQKYLTTFETLGVIDIHYII